MIEVETMYLERDTAFYETVLFVSDSGLAMLVKRYGKLDLKKGGGAVIVETGSAASMRASASKVINSKINSGKGYSYKSFPWGMHTVTKGQPNSLSDVCNIAHYTGQNSDIYRRLREEFASDVAVTTAPAAPAKPEPEIDRGSTWGSF